MPVSPLGRALYHGTSDGILALRVPDLKLQAKLSPGVSFDEVWVSGNGGYLYAIADQGKKLLLMRTDGTVVSSVVMPPGGYGFIASEHG